MQTQTSADQAVFPAQAPSLLAQYTRVRRRSLALTAHLQPEDTVVQSMASASPAKWHLAHTTWFFEQFVLAGAPGYRALHPDWLPLLNSYYETVGALYPRLQRGLLSRPTLREILDFRARIDERMQAVLVHANDEQRTVITLGLHHEQQHQELLLTDIKHAFSINPLQPAYQEPARAIAGTHAVPLRFLPGQPGLAQIGQAPDAGFSFDNETPRHPVLLHPHAIANRPINNAEYREFIHAGGYRTATLWMSEGWAQVQQNQWQRPLYWHEDLSSAFTLAGRQELDPLAPVCHVSFFEADAFARWAGARLPTEAEWEVIAAAQATHGNFQESGYLQPRAPFNRDGALQLFGDVWEWTSSPYVSYPGFHPLGGALGEYNAKFMCGQWVLRGGSCATPADHIRASYRNFFYPQDRWQFSGFRLGKDA